jgi:diguanylate cyclase (GGDEF)-like protein/PAS domain S-box-containing protein
MRLNLRPHQARWGISFLVLSTYLLLFFLLYPDFREGTAALVILPVAVIAWQGGARAGLSAGILSLPLNTLLLNLAEPRISPWTVVIQSGGGPGSLVIALLGIVVGLIHDQQSRMAQELASRQPMEDALREGEQRYRKLLETARREEQERALLDQVRQALARELDLPVLFRIVVEAIAKTFGYTQVSLYLVEGEVLLLQHQVGYEQVIRRIPLTDGVSGRVVRSQQPALLEDVGNDPAFLGAIEGIVSEVCVPLFDQGKVAGVLNVESTQGVRLSQADLRLMMALAEHVGIAIGRARLYAEVQANEERFKLMAWATKDAVWDWNLRTGQIWWGEGLQKIFHYSAIMAESDSEWWFGQMHPEDQDKVRGTIQKAVEEGLEFWSKEYRFQRRDQTYADIMDRGYILRDEAGQAYRMVGAMIDISERKQMELSLLEANRQMKQMLNEVEGRNREIALLNELSRLLQAAQSEREAYAIIAELSRQLFPATAGVLYLLDGTRTQVRAAASWGDFSSSRQVFAPDECLALRCGPTHPLRGDLAASRCAHLTEPWPAVSYCLPLSIAGEILGVLNLHSQQEEYLGESKRQLVYTVVEQSMMALSNLRLREALREQSIRDPLTGLFNRRYMEETLKREVSRVTRELRPLGMLMIDIDHFKHFNDNYGHTAGDALLQSLGQFLQGHIRSEDVACRYGGEEFILIMPNATVEVTRQRADDLRQEVKQMQVQSAGQTHKGITLSMGIAIYPEHGRTIEAVLRAADAALYRAKQEGRDRVITAR